MMSQMGSSLRQEAEPDGKASTTALALTAMTFLCPNEPSPVFATFSASVITPEGTGACADHILRSGARRGLKNK